MSTRKQKSTSKARKKILTITPKIKKHKKTKKRTQNYLKNTKSTSKRKTNSSFQQMGTQSTKQQKQYFSNKTTKIVTQGKQFKKKLKKKTQKIKNKFQRKTSRVFQSKQLASMLQQRPKTARMIIKSKATVKKYQLPQSDFFLTQQSNVQNQMTSEIQKPALKPVDFSAFIKDEKSRQLNNNERKCILNLKKIYNNRMRKISARGQKYTTSISAAQVLKDCRHTKKFVELVGDKFVEKAFSYYPSNKLMGHIILETIKRYGDEGNQLDEDKIYSFIFQIMFIFKDVQKGK